MYINIDEFLEFREDKQDRVKVLQPFLFQYLLNSKILIIPRNPLFIMNDFLGDIPREEVYFQKRSIEVRKFGISERLKGYSQASIDQDGFLFYAGFFDEIEIFKTQHKNAFIYIPHAYKYRRRNKN